MIQNHASSVLPVDDAKPHRAMDGLDQHGSWRPKGEMAMRAMHEELLSAVFQERQRLVSRRDLLAGGSKLLVGGALATTAIGGVVTRGGSVLAQDEMMDFANDLEVLQYALTLEHLEHAFYRDGVGLYDFGAGPYNEDIGAWLMSVGEHEKAHVDTLVAVIEGMNEEPVAEALYDFGHTDAQSFLVTAAALENTGVMAYDGAGQYLTDPGLLTAAGTIVAVEARHASYLNLLTGAAPFPAAYETPATKAEILAIATPLFVS